MANTQRGEVGFKALDQDWTIKLGTNAMCEAEDATGKTINELGVIMGDPEQFTLSLMRTLMFCGMVDFHPNLSRREVGNIIDDIGFDEMSRLVGEAFALATPEAKDTANPRKAAKA